MIVTLSRAPKRDLELNYWIVEVPNGATSDDYTPVPQATPGTVTIPANQLTGTIAVDTRNDDNDPFDPSDPGEKVEPNETLQVVVAAGKWLQGTENNGTESHATVTIKDDDVALLMQSNALSRNESAASVPVTISYRAIGMTNAVANGYITSLDVQISPIMAPVNPATPNVDYVRQDGMFPVAGNGIVNDGWRTFSVRVIDDAINEPDPEHASFHVSGFARVTPPGEDDVELVFQQRVGFNVGDND